MVEFLKRVPLLSELSKLFSSIEEDLETETKRIAVSFRTHSVSTRIVILTKLKEDLLEDAIKQHETAVKNLSEITQKL